MEPVTGKAVHTQATFTQSCAVSTDINASAERIWSILTRADDFPRWNSTVSSIDGTIALGERLRIKVPISERTFKVNVVEFEANRRMMWADGHRPMFRGVRVYTLEPRNGATRFSMTETFSGLMLPMIRKTLPDFVPVFTAYAADLKREAEHMP